MEHIFSRSNYVLKYRFSRKNTFFDTLIILPSVGSLPYYPCPPLIKVRLIVWAARPDCWPGPGPGPATEL